MASWRYRGWPEPGRDARCLVTLESASRMRWVGIRAWHHQDRMWLNGNEPEQNTVIAWSLLPEPAKGVWVRGQLIGVEGGGEGVEP